MAVVRNQLNLGAAVLLASVFAAVAGEASPFSDSEAVAIIDLATGKAIDCTRPPEQDEDRTVQVTRRIATLRFDPCEWTASVDETDRRKPATVYRSGADISCGLEESDGGPSVSLGPNAYSDYLVTKGVEEVALESDEEQVLGGIAFHYQVLSGTMPEAFDPAKPRYRVHAWFSSLEQGLVMLACLGPIESIDRERLAIQSLARSLRVVTP